MERDNQTYFADHTETILFISGMWHVCKTFAIYTALTICLTPTERLRTMFHFLNSFAKGFCPCFVLFFLFNAGGVTLEVIHPKVVQGTSLMGWPVISGLIQIEEGSPPTQRLRVFLLLLLLLKKKNPSDCQTVKYISGVSKWQDIVTVCSGLNENF